jgi:hypothetical protein
VTDLVRTGGDEDVESLRDRLADLESALDARNAQILRVQTDLAAFRLRYRREVGLLHDELEELERSIAELELGEIEKRLGEGARDTPPAEAPAGQPARALTSDAVKRLFRDVAKAVHPDLADDDLARDRRHTLMIEANRAYALGDEERLRSILETWQNSPEAVPGDGPGAGRERLRRRVAQVDRQLAACGAELAELQDLPLWRLKTMVDEAAGRGRDLVADQVRRLKRDITAARNRLDAMRL